ncbi:hypothetical protein FNH05_33310 [Amycolatopsis rhizosphaerae]|uniref:Uncharacterized protein n=1 Tax=Amycolatopsis rhizosphaerae TaxID=2053003 RepID=A0A558AER0_9PSEU|nr:hypothetical protein FNH05_33310 [Amycolatopsis rhizosphaerae]
MLRTGDPVERVKEFYDQAIEQGGWQVVSKTEAGGTAAYVVKKQGQGASVSLSPAPGDGQTLISISTYPSP